MKEVWITTETFTRLEHFYHDNMDLIHDEGYPSFTQWVDGMIKESLNGFWFKYAREQRSGETPT